MVIVDFPPFETVTSEMSILFPAVKFILPPELILSCWIII